MTDTEMPREESLTIEFKSDRKGLNDHALVEAVICMANTEGGTLYLGIENDGIPTGVDEKQHGDPHQLAAMIANRTAPRLSVRVDRVEVENVPVMVVHIPKSTAIVGTLNGTYKRRRIDGNGRPECVAFLPHEMGSRLADVGAIDPTASPVPSATAADLDPAERARTRQFIERYGGDQALLDLTDDQLDGALGFVDPDGTPTRTGLLMIGRDEALRRLMPSHEAAFQVLQGEDVRFNEFQRSPLLRLFEWMETQFSARNDEEELQVGLFRVGVPRVDKQAFREALANAFVHRDYARLGAVHVKLDDRELTISNPGGFVEGLTPANILRSPPRPRNPALADAFKRVGLVERTGRGVDRIYREVVRFGRPRPSYAQSDRTMVVLQIPAAEADLALLRHIIAAENEGRTLPTISLIALSVLRDLRRVDVDEMSELLHVDRAEAKSALEGLMEAGLVEAHGRTRSRTYTLAKRIYAEQGDATGYDRQVGPSADAQADQVVAFVKEHGQTKRAEIAELCRLSPDQATRLLTRLVESGRLVREGQKRGARYRLPEEP